MASDIQLSVDLEPGDVTNTADKLQAETERIFNRHAGKTVDESFMRLQTSMRNAYTTANELRAQMSALESSTRATPIYAEYENALDKLMTKFNALTERQQKFIDLGGDPKSKAFESMNYDAEKLGEQINTIHKEMRELRDSGEAFVPGTATQEYSALEQKLININDQMRQYILRARSMGEYAPPITGWSLAKTAIMGVVNGLKLVGKGAISAAQAIGKISASALKRAASAAKELAKRLFTIAKTTVTNELKKLGNSILHIGKSSKSAQPNVKKLFTMFLKYGLGIRSLYFLFRKLRSALAEGFKNLAGYSEPFNHTISDLISSLNYLKNSFAAAFAPLVSVVAPILTQFIDKMASAVNVVGQFFAALTGKQTFVQAKKLYTSYTKATDKSTDKTQKKIEKLQKTILGFDDVNILKGPDDDNDTASASDYDPSTDPKNMFDTVKIGNGINDWVKKFKDMWAKADFTDLGRIVGEKLRDALNRIPWDKVKAILRKIAKSIATFLNGFLEVPGLFDAIGRTLAQALNSAFEFVNAFVTNFHWDSLGTAIKDLILGVLTNIDWPLIYDTMAKRGAGIGTSLNTALNNPEIWSAIFGTLGNALNALALLILNFFTNVSWSEVGTNIAIGMNNAIQNDVDWALLGTTISTAILGLLDLFIYWAENFEWKAFGEKVGVMLGNIEWKKIIYKVFEAIGAVLGGLAAFIWGIIENQWDKVVQWWYDNAYKDGQFTITGLLDGIVDKLNNIGTWIKDHIFKPFINGFKKAFGIASPSKEMKTQGQYIAQGMLDGITDKLKTIGSWIKTNVFDKVKNGLDTAFGIVGGIANKIKSVGESVISGLKSGAEGKESILTNALRTITSNMESTLSSGNWSGIGSNILSGIESGIQSGWSWLSTTVSNLAGSLFDTACNVLGIQSPSRLFRDKVGKMIPAGLAIGINAESDTALNAVNDLSNQMLNNTLKDIKIPPIAMGEIIPPSIGKSDQQDMNNTLNNVLEMLQYNQDAMITRDDLAEILTDLLPDMLRRYVSFTIGDEQLARHTNTGNAKLNRRFKTTLAST